MNLNYRKKNAQGITSTGQTRGHGAVPQGEQRRGPKRSVARDGKAPSLSPFEKMQRIGLVPLKTKMVFFRQMATMINSGLNLGMAINIAAEQEKNLIFKDSLIDIKNRMDRGIAFSQAMESHPRMFDNTMTSLVAAGEEGGFLDKALERVASLLEKQQTLKSKIRSAMFYPCFIILFAVAIVCVFIAFIIPQFRQVFLQMNIELPALTQAMFVMGDYCITHRQGIVGGIVAIVVCLVWLLKSEATKPFMDKVKLKLPVINSLVLKSSMARATQTLSALVSAGVPLLRGLEMAETTAGNFVISDGFAKLQTATKQGTPLGEAAHRAKIFPAVVYQMMNIGEETGNLDMMLERVAAWYYRELDEQVKALTSLLEPVMLVLIGGMVALIAMSIYGPIISAMQQMM